ncbi:MAG: hypothetical protein K2N72_12175 [Oscillospiraceae bacterium]|nr:hypothetical protein [Oscillospiraceae bacterium]
MDKKTPQSQLKWQKKYDLEKMTTIGLKIPITERRQIENAAAENGLKLATFCRKCIKYCINNNIDISDITTGTDTK